MPVTLVHSSTQPKAAPAPKKRVVLFYPEFVHVAGSVDAALLLSQLAYWFQPGPKGKPRVRVRRNGRLTYVRSNEAMREDTGLSEWRLRKARERLEASGLVEVEVHLFGNKTLPHWWLDLHRLESEVALKTGPEVCTTPVLSALSGSCIKLCEEEEVREEENAPEAAREEGEGELDFEIVEEGFEELEREDHVGVKFVKPEAAAGVSAAQVAARLAARRETGGKLSAGALAGAWKKHLFDKTGNFQKQWTGKELGQAGKLTRALGDQAWPVVRWALDNWPALAFEVKQAKGTGSAPAEPHLGWLLQYHDVAVRMYTQGMVDSRVPVILDGSYVLSKAVVEKVFPHMVQPVAPAEQAASAEEAATALAVLTKKADK